MTALAQVFKAQGSYVSGSDIAEIFFTDEVLKKLRIPVYEGFSEKNLHKYPADMYIASSAYTTSNNPEVAYLSRMGTKIFSYAEALGIAFNNHARHGIIITGTHGKTTTTALVGTLLKTAKKDPTVVVGSRVRAWRTNAIVGRSKYWAIEGDEYQDKLSYYNPYTVILTHLEYDHPDFFPDFATYKKTFKKFVARIPRAGSLIACGDHAAVRDVARHTRARVIFYGFNKNNNVRVIPISQDTNTQTFSLHVKNKKPVVLTTPLPGRHNLLNVAAAYILATQLRCSTPVIKKICATFSGTSRRFEIIKSSDPIVIDDYAHHPTEVRATLEGARARFPDKKIIALFHPHTFSRTKALMDDFATSFTNADHTIVIEIYGSAREKKGGVSSRELVQKINAHHSKSEYARDLTDALKRTQTLIAKNKKEDLVILTIGAGDVWKIAKKL